MTLKGSALNELNPGYNTLSHGHKTTDGVSPDITATHGTTALTLDAAAYGARVIEPGHWRTGRKPQPRRPSRARETSPLHRGHALNNMPVKAQPARSQAAWLTATETWISRLHKRDDFTRNLLAISRVLGFNAHWETLTTTTLSWGRIAADTGLTRRTVANHLRFLHEHGWLARVAAGRSATAKAAAGMTGPHAESNDAPVYLLAQPETTEPWDTTFTPPTSSGYKEFLRTREADTPSGAATRPDISSGAAVAGRTPTRPGAHRPESFWPRYVPVEHKRDRIRAAAEIGRIAFVFRRLHSPNYLAWLLKDFFTAGWTVDDVLHAIDTRPDGLPQGHDLNGEWIAYTGADGISQRGLPHWINYRLNTWRDTAGLPLPSKSQTRAHRRTRRAAAEHRRRQAIERAHTEQNATESAHRSPTTTASAEKQAALARMRAITGAHFHTLTRHDTRKDS